MVNKKKVSQEDAHFFYIWEKEMLGVLAIQKWNFHKYLINREGKIIDYFHSTTSPQKSVFKKAIEKALAKYHTAMHP